MKQDRKTQYFCFDAARLELYYHLFGSLGMLHHCSSKTFDCYGYGKSWMLFYFVWCFIINHCSDYTFAQTHTHTQCLRIVKRTEALPRWLNILYTNNFSAKIHRIYYVLRFIHTSWNGQMRFGHVTMRVRRVRVFQHTIDIFALSFVAKWSANRVCQAHVVTCTPFSIIKTYYGRQASATVRLLNVKTYIGR